MLIWIFIGVNDRSATQIMRNDSNATKIHTRRRCPSPDPQSTSVTDPIKRSLASSLADSSAKSYSGSKKPNSMERGLHDRFDSISEGVQWESSRGEGSVYEEPGITNLPFLPITSQSLRIIWVSFRSFSVFIVTLSL